MAFENISSSGYPMSINGGVPIGKPITSPYNNLKHVEKNSFDRHAAGKNQFLGLMKLWNHYSYVNTPLISMTELSKNVLETNGFNTTFTFGIPFEKGAPFLLEALIKDTSKPGLGKKPFHIVVSENLYSNGDVITSDVRNGKQLQVCTIQEYGDEAKIVPYGDGWKLMVVPAGMSLEDFYPTAYLQPLTRYYKVYQENGGEFQNVATNKTGRDKSAVQLFEYTVGDSEMAIETWFTSQAQLITMHDQNNKGIHPSVQHLSHDMGAKDAITNFFNVDPVTGEKVKGTGSWIPTFIGDMIAELAELKEKKVLWSQGNARITNGREVVTTGLGYYQQIKQRGNYYTYSTFKQLFNFLQNFTSILFANNRNVKPENRTIKWRMGSGAAEELRKQWGAYFKTDNPFLITGEHPALKNMLKADPKNGATDVIYTPLRFSKIFMPEVGLIEFEVDTNLDWIDGDIEGSKMTGGKMNSAYMVFVEDVTDKNFSNAMLQGQTNSVGGSSYDLGNTVMIKPKGYVDTLNYMVGSGYIHPILSQYAGQPAHRSTVSTREKGFGVMAYTCGEVWVQDPTRMLMLEYFPEVK
jgi:hypothetical protein